MPMPRTATRCTRVSPAQASRVAASPRIMSRDSAFMALARRARLGGGGRREPADYLRGQRVHGAQAIERDQARRAPDLGHHFAHMRCLHPTTSLTTRARITSAPPASPVWLGASPAATWQPKSSSECRPMAIHFSVSAPIRAVYRTTQPPIVIEQNLADRLHVTSRTHYVHGQASRTWR